jgi:predicted ATPase
VPYRPALLTEQETTVAVRDTYPVGYRVSSPNFVGRAEELDLLDAAFERVTGGRTATVLIGGDAGIGKTRLVEEFCRRARDRGALVARQLGESATAAMLSPTGPGPADGNSSGSRTVDEFAKTRLFESVLICFQQLAERSPVVLVFEDLQWADSASTELLDYLARNLSDARALFIGTYRTEELVRDHPLRPWLTELGRHARVTPLGLDGFDRDTTAGLIAGILGHRPDWALAEAVWARSQGNPFFAEELTAARHSPSLSAELQGVIMTRVEALSKDA